MAMVLAVAFSINSAPLQAQEADEAEETATQGGEPLEVDIFPRMVPSEGMLEDAIIETRDGRFLLYSGWFFENLDRVLDHLPIINSAGDYGAFVRGLTATYRPDPDPDEPHYLPYGGQPELVFGPEYKGMTAREISYAFGLDPDRHRAYIPAGRGIYVETPFNTAQTLASTALGSISFEGHKLVDGALAIANNLGDK